jgi:hypothetical protein
MVGVNTEGTLQASLPHELPASPDKLLGGEISESMLSSD